MGIKKHIAIFSFVVFFLAIGFQSKSSAESAPSSKFQNLLQSGTLRVGIAHFTPWVFKDKKGVLAGFEIDVATKLAKDMNLAPNFISHDWDKLMPVACPPKTDPFGMLGFGSKTC